MLEKVVIILSAFGLVVLIALVLALPLMWIWDYLMPDMFGLKEITLWQSFWLQVLCGFLFKSSSN